MKQCWCKKPTLEFQGLFSYFDSFFFYEDVVDLNWEEI